VAYFLTNFNFYVKKYRFFDNMENSFSSQMLWFRERAIIYRNLSQDEFFFDNLQMVIGFLLLALRNGNKLLIFGNGGSAAEAQHFAAELVGRFRKDRPPIAAIALTTDTSIITAQSNDTGFPTIFSRQIDALGKPGDIAICFTTSDVGDPHDEKSHSRNLFEGMMQAKVGGLTSLCFGSKRTRELAHIADQVILVPHEDGAIIQEVQLCLIHYICDKIEAELFP
jgi:D-sedoheptulose 7-phosphate isomerase